MRCNKCGSQVYNGEWYCGECGAKIDFSSGNMQENNYNYSYKDKSKTKKTIIIVLSVIIGIIIILGIIGLLTNDEDTNNAISQNNYVNNSTAVETTNTNRANSNEYNYNANTNTSISTNTYTPSTTNSTDNNYNNDASNSDITNNNNSGTINNNNQKAYTRYYLQYNGQEYSNIYIELSGTNIYLYDKDLELYFRGTFKVNNNLVTGSYTQVKYNNGGDIMTIDCNDEFEFQIISTNQLQDKLGYYSYVDGQIMHRNAIYYKE